MEINKIIETRDFDIDQYKSNRGSANVYRYTKENGTEIKQMEFPGGYVEIEIPSKPHFYNIQKFYYQNGKIQKAGTCMDFLPIGIWRYYDENGKETIVDEDEKYGIPNYNDILVFLDKNGYINLRTGERRDKISIGYEPDRKIWKAYVFNFNGKNHEYAFNQKGKVIDHKIYTPTE